MSVWSMNSPISILLTLIRLFVLPELNVTSLGQALCILNYSFDVRYTAPQTPNNLIPEISIYMNAVF